MYKNSDVLNSLEELPREARIQIGQALAHAMLYSSYQSMKSSMRSNPDKELSEQRAGVYEYYLVNKVEISPCQQFRDMISNASVT